MICKTILATAALLALLPAPSAIAQNSLDHRHTG